jgi:hypothetical protein
MGSRGVSGGPVMACFQLVLGVGFGLAAVLVDAEPSCGGCGHGHWGGTAGVVALSVWLALIGAGLAYNLTRDER